MHWVEDGSTVTNTADFSFDTLLQQGNISGFWTDETGTWMFEEGWLADGTYDFTVSSAVATYSELTDFDIQSPVFRRQFCQSVPIGYSLAQVSFFDAAAQQ